MPSSPLSSAASADSNAGSANLFAPEQCARSPPTAYLTCKGALTVDLTLKPVAVWRPHCQATLRPHSPLPALSHGPTSDAVFDRQRPWNAAFRALGAAMSARAF